MDFFKSLHEQNGGQTVAGVASQRLSLLCYLVLAKPLPTTSSNATSAMPSNG
jgi:hypothetical protein